MIRISLLSFLIAAPVFAQEKPEKTVYEKDLEFALEKIPQLAGGFFKYKEINWEAISKEFSQSVKAVKNDSEHLALLLKLVARLKDGNATVRPVGEGEKASWPENAKDKPAASGFFLCKNGKSLIVKLSVPAVESMGVKPGVEVISLDGTSVQKWIETKIALLKQVRSFSTEMQAFYTAAHWGLWGNEGSKLSVEIKTPDGKTKKVSVPRRRDVSPVVGPAIFPKGVKEQNGNRYGKTKAGFAYLHLKEFSKDLPAQLDSLLKELNDAPGMILDLRGNAGGDGDVNAVVGRWIPKGKVFRKPGGLDLTSVGENPYGGNLVILIDAGVQGNSELFTAILKEEGRAYVLGDTHSSGSCAKTKELELPSHLFVLKLSTQTYKEKYNGGMGMEGVGVFPTEIVEYDPKDLLKGEDTLIKKAEALLARFPKEKVAYHPEDFGWAK